VLGPYPGTELTYAENLQAYGAAEAGLVMMPLPYQLFGLTHETAHQWWGCAVRLRHDFEVWLNEGFASYSEVLFQEDSLGLFVRWAELDTMARRYRSVPRAQDRPIIPAPTNSNYYFTIVYSKGAWVLHMLRSVLGDSVFFRVLNTYSLTSRDSSVTVAGFRQVAEQLSGLTLDWFFDEWLYHVGYPKYHLDWSAAPVGDSVRVVTRLSQLNGSGAPAFFRTPLPIRLALPGPDTNVVIAPGANPEVDTFVINGQPTGVAVDPDDWILDSSYITMVGVAERHVPEVHPVPAVASVVRGVLWLGAGTVPQPGASDALGLSRAALLDIAGRKVLDLHPGPNDVSQLAPGVYFVRGAPGVHKVLLTR
jgi:hypothetical protein